MEEKEFSFEERVARCALNAIFGFEPRKGLALMEGTGGALAVFRTQKEELARILGPGNRTRLLDRITEQAFDAAAMELELLERDGCRFICLGEEAYPPLLMECQDPPLGLYYKGVSPPGDVFGSRRAIAAVGTRDPSPYGKEWCRRIVGSIAKSPSRPLIVSGLALGIDGIAHRTALEAGLPTVAVMATGIDKLYPSTNRGLGERIASTPGCALVTDYPPGTDAVRINFLRRNRIIAGIAGATILIESKVKGGGMMTARLAASYGRDVFALPGRLDDPMSQGCNLLVRETQAVPVGDMGIFMNDLGLDRPAAAPPQDFRESLETFYRERLSPGQMQDTLRTALRIKASRGISLDELCRCLNLPFGTISRIATMLECDGFITIDLLQHCSISPEARDFAR
ncbi:MAG: DNA-processing protein DprA [Candidatus Cryptobacteroides sp.]